MKIHRGLLFTALALAVALPALAGGPPQDPQHKQAQKQLKTSVKVMTKQQVKEQAQAVDSFKQCLESLRDDLDSGLPAEPLLEDLRDCVGEFVHHLAGIEYACRDGVMEQAGELLGQLDGTPPGFVRGDGGVFDKALAHYRVRSQKRLLQGLKLVDKTLAKSFSERDYAFAVRAEVPGFDDAIPVADGVVGDLRVIPFVSVLVAGSSLAADDDGLLFACGYSFDPTPGPGLAEPVPSLDAVQIEGREGLASLADVPLTALESDEPISPENPAMRWKAGFSQLDDLKELGALPEGNYLVRAIQNGVVGMATIGIP